MTINEWSDATAMAEAVQNKAVSPRELVEATIREAERTNPKINAIVSQRYCLLYTSSRNDATDSPDITLFTSRGDGNVMVCK